MSPYAKRDRLLKGMGFDSYEAYLASPLWRGIRTHVMKRACDRCEVCRRAKATEAHHESYRIEALEGRATEQIIAICGNCHDAIEFDKKGRKRAFHQVAEALARMRRERTGKPVCTTCGRRPGKGDGLCKACRRQKADRDHEALTGQRRRKWTKAERKKRVIDRIRGEQARYAAKAERHKAEARERDRSPDPFAGLTTLEDRVRARIAARQVSRSEGPQIPINTTAGP